MYSFVYNSQTLHQPAIEYIDITTIGATLNETFKPIGYNISENNNNESVDDN